MSYGSVFRRMIPTIALLAACMATTCFVSKAVAVLPSPDVNPDSVKLAASSIVERIATRYQLTWNPRLGECFARDGFSLCRTSHDGQTEFRLRQNGMRFGSLADSVHNTLLESLAERFGAKRVRECTEGGSPYRCPVIVVDGGS